MYFSFTSFYCLIFFNENVFLFKFFYFQLKEEHCVLVVLPCGQDRSHIIEQSTILNNAFITYLQQKQAAGIINIVPPGATVVSLFYFFNYFFS